MVGLALLVVFLDRMTEEHFSLLDIRLDMPFFSLTDIFFTSHGRHGEHGLFFFRCAQEIVHARHSLSKLDSALA